MRGSLGQESGKTAVFWLVIPWCPGWGSNPQDFRRKILSLLRLPIPPPGPGSREQALGNAAAPQCKSQTLQSRLLLLRKPYLPLLPLAGQGHKIFLKTFECFPNGSVYLCVISCLLGCLVCWLRRPSGWFPGGRLSSFSARELRMAPIRDRRSSPAQGFRAKQPHPLSLSESHTGGGQAGLLRGFARQAPRSPASSPPRPV
jgi:hypothetical protein